MNDFYFPELAPDGPEKKADDKGTPITPGTPFLDRPGGKQIGKVTRSWRDGDKEMISIDLNDAGNKLMAVPAKAVAPKPARATIDAPGIYPDFPVRDYFNDPCPAPSLNQSLVKILLDETPAHAKCAHPRLGSGSRRDEDYDKDRAIGNALHALLLGRGKKMAIAHFDDWRRGEAKDFRTDAYASGDEPILKKHYDQALYACRSIQEQFSEMSGRQPLTGGVAEVVIAWEEEGFWFRSMLDYSYENRILEDLKTSGSSVSPAAAPFQMSDWGWQIQAAFQERGLNKLDPDNQGRRRFRFVACENKEPFGVVVNELSEGVLTIGRQMVDMAIRRWKACMRSGRWPSYSTDTNYPEFPGHKQAAWEERYRKMREEYDAEGI